MKKLFSLTLLMLFAASSVFAQHKAVPNKDRKSPHETVTGKNVKVTYGRPYIKGREIFGGLVPYGQVWRTGADEATEITFEKDATFGGQKVKKGTYALFTIPMKDQWGIILNGKLGQWGAFSYDKNKDKDVLHTKVPVSALSNPVEQFTIKLEKDGMIMEWDKTSVKVPIQF